MVKTQTSYNPPIPRQIQRQVEQAWALRYEQKIEEFSEVFSDLKKQLKIHSMESVFEFESNHGPSIQAPVRIEVALLHVSWLRAQSNLNASDLFLKKTAQALNSENMDLPFEYLMQTGLNRMVRGNYTAAVDDFLLAKRKSKNTSEKTKALLNILFCFENLGISTELTWAEVVSELKKNPSRDAGSLAQIKAYELRLHFRKADFQAIFSDGKIPPVSQAEYFRLWAMELPYHFKSAHKDRNALERFALYPSYFHQKSYRFRTLQGLIHPEDLLDFKVTEFADRLYLWTWRWLIDPETFPVERVMSLIRGVNWKDLSVRMTSEDYQMIRNSMLWLSLFDPSSSSLIHEVTSSIRPHSVEDDAIYAYERVLIAYWIARRDGDSALEKDLFEQLRSNELSRSKYFLLGKLLEESPAEGDLTLLKQRIHQWVDHAPQDQNARLKVDLLLNQVTELGTGKITVSSPMCLGLELLHRKRVVECAEFAQVCFGLSRYDSMIHSTKVFNLLARLRQCTPDGLSFSVRSEKVYSQGDWSPVIFRKKAGVAGELKHQPEWQDLMRGRSVLPDSKEAEDRRTHTALLLEKLSGREEIRREDIEKLTGKSRSTVNRILNRWLRRGVVQKFGSARRTRYKVNRPS